MNTDMSRRQFVGLAGSLATVLGLGLVGCGGGAGKGSAAGSAAAKDVKGAAESKKLVVGFDKSYPPYGFVGDDGEYTGFDLDLAKAVADKQGWEVKYEAIDWDAIEIKRRWEPYINQLPDYAYLCKDLLNGKM